MVSFQKRVGDQFLVQRIQHATLVSRVPHVNLPALEEFLESISYPLHYLDFEAVNSAVPRYEGTRPWEHVPYLFSVHTEPGRGSELKHSWFLMDPRLDQRRDLLQALLSLTDAGTILVYGATFETGILRRLAELFADESDRVESMIERVADLLRPFNEFTFYHHHQRGKVSLKTVLPILTDESYSGLTVKDGYSANLAYRYLVSSQADNGSSAETAALSDDLVQYCTMDTLAMVRIMSRLWQIAADGHE